MNIIKRTKHVDFFHFLELYCTCYHTKCLVKPILKAPEEPSSMSIMLSAVEKQYYEPKTKHINGKNQRENVPEDTS